MPARSQAQFRFLQALIHGGLKYKAPDMSKPEAQEFIDKTPSYVELPEKTPRLKKLLRK